WAYRRGPLRALRSGVVASRHCRCVAGGRRLAACVGLSVVFRKEGWRHHSASQPDQCIGRCMTDLTIKQDRIVDEYLIDLNTTQAAICAGHSPGSADKIG